MTRSDADIIRNAFDNIFLHLDSNNDRLEQKLKKKWVELGNEISFAGVSKIYNYCDVQNPARWGLCTTSGGGRPLPLV